MGKTTFGVQLAQQVAEKADKPVLIFSLEMSVAAHWPAHVFPASDDIDHDHVRSSKMDQDEWARVTLAANKMAKLPAED